MQSDENVYASALIPLPPMKQLMKQMLPLRRKQMLTQQQQQQCRRPPRHGLGLSRGLVIPPEAQPLPPLLLPPVVPMVQSPAVHKSVWLPVWLLGWKIIRAWRCVFMGLYLWVYGFVGVGVGAALPTVGVQSYALQAVDDMRHPTYMALSAVLCVLCTLKPLCHLTVHMSRSTPDTVYQKLMFSGV